MTHESMDATERCRALLQRCSHHDKDERYMAISDLRGEIDTMEIIDVSMQTSMRQTMLKRLEDSSSDVQAIAVNCFSSMVEKFDPSQVIEITGTLCNLSNIKSGGSDLKEVYAEALRGILERVPVSLGEQVSNLLLPVILGTLSSNVQSDKRNENDEQFWCLMLLQTVLERFVGSSIGDANCQNILTILLRLLKQESDYNNSLIPSVVSSFTNFCQSHLLAKLVQEIISEIVSDLPDQKVAVLVLTLSDMARKAGSRLVQHSSSIIPVLEKLSVPAGPVNFEDAQEEIVMIRYHSLVVLEYLVRSGPQHVAPYCTSLLNTALTLMTLDPNYMENHDAEVAMDEFDGDDWGLEPDVAPEEDSGDTTWKVRLVALRLLLEWINCSTFKSSLLSNIHHLFEQLIARFDERDVTAQVQVFDTFSALLKRLSVLSSEISIDDTAARYQSQTMSELRRQIMSGKLEVKRSTANALLRLLEFFGSRIFSQEVLQFILSEIVDKSDTSVQLIGLESFKTMIKILPSSELRDLNVQIIIQPLISIMTDDSSKPGVAPFEIITAICKCFRPDDERREVSEMNLLFQPLFDIAKQLPKYPTEMRISACLTLAEFCSYFGGSLPSSDFHNCIELFLSSVEVRNIELTGIQCLTIMANSTVSSVEKALEPHTGRIFKTLLDLVSVKDKDANVVAPYLSVLAAFIIRYPASISDSLLSECLKLCAKLDDPSTVTVMHHLCANLLELSTKRKKFSPSHDMIKTFTDQAVRVLTDPDMQHRSSIQSSKSLLVAAFSLHSDKEYGQLMKRLLSMSTESDIPLTALGSAIAACYVAHFKQDGLVKEISALLQPIDNKTEIGYLQLILVIIGDVARLSPLPDSFLKKLFSFLSSYFDYEDEHVKASAATSLGACTAANPSALLHLLLDRVSKSGTESVCFPLHALKEVLVSVNPDRIYPDVADTILPILMRHADSDNEGVRAIASECLGKLLAFNRAQFAAKIQSGLKSSSQLLRASIVTAVKFYYAQMRDEGIPGDWILPLLYDSDLAVRRQAFLAMITLLNSAKHIANLDAVLDTLISQSVKDINVRAELVRKIDFGAFQETVDEGLLLRQAAYSCLKTIAELFPEHIPAQCIILELARHSVDEPDLELQRCAYDIISGVASNLSPGISVSFFEELPPSFLPAIKNRLAQVKRNANDSDARRVLSAFIIAVHKLHSVPGVKADCPKFHIFYLQVLKTSILSDLLKEHEILDSKF